MITYWQYQEGLKEINHFAHNCWVNVINPSSEEVKFLIKRFKVPEEFIKDIIDIDERSRTEIDENWMLIILRIPLYNENNILPYLTLPLGVLVSNKCIITICLSENEIINDVIHPSKSITVNPENRPNFVLQLFLKSSSMYLKYLKQINIHTSIIESELERSTRNKELHKLLKMEKCLVYFITSLKANDLVLYKLQNSRYTNLSEDDKDMLEDVLVENKQAIEMANIYSDILSGLMDAFASIISNNLNMIMKQLTSVTIILMIPTLIASIYGMNLKNHMETSNIGFFIIVGFSLLAAFVGVLFFRRKKWF